MVKIYAFIISAAIAVFGIVAAVDAMGNALDTQASQAQQAQAFIAHAQAAAQAGR